MKIQVTKEDIALGVTGNCALCPVALAVSRQTCGHVMISDFSIEYNGCDYPSPLSVRDFVRNFDFGKCVEPFDFDLPI